ncbi:MAG: sulfurtransferase complex subunit TusC [Pseudomonadota bacterium]
MSDTARKRTLLTIRRSPYATSLARASIEAALAMAAFDQTCNLLFCGDGVLQLMPGQQSETIGARNLNKLLQSLPLYDIDHIYVDSHAAQRYGVDLSKLPMTVHTLSDSEMQSLLSEHDHLLGF